MRRHRFTLALRPKRRAAARLPRLRIGPAHPGDALEVATIMSRWIDETDWISRVHTFEQEHSFVRDLIAHGWVTVARRAGRVVGFLARDGQDVIALYVATEARGAGVGRALLAEAQRAAQRLELWTFQFNEGAQRFYLAAGFHEVERTGGAGNDEKLPDIRYVWHRPPPQPMARRAARLIGRRGPQHGGQHG